MSPILNAKFPTINTTYRTHNNNNMNTRWSDTVLKNQ